MNLGFVLLFVNDPATSATFYRNILQKDPVEESPTFALFVLQNNVNLGLWSNKTAEPIVTAPAGASEIAFGVDNVDAWYDTWVNLNIPMAQPPTDMDFGRTFVALDPDGHRIRIYKLRN